MVVFDFIVIPKAMVEEERDVTPLPDRATADNPVNELTQAWKYR
jgi:hypothetical protein